MTPLPPQLDHLFCDTYALDRHRKRAIKQNRNNTALFLHHEAIADIKDRLKTLTHHPKRTLIVTAFGALWQDAFPHWLVVPPHQIYALNKHSYDLIVHGLDLHWSNTPIQDLIACYQAIQDQGVLIAALFGENTLVELRTSLAATEARLINGAYSRVAPMARIQDLATLLLQSGFRNPVVDKLSQRVVYANAFALMRDLRAMGETNALTTRRRYFSRRDVFEQAAHHYQTHYPNPDGMGVCASFDVLFMTGWVNKANKPHAL